MNRKNTIISSQPPPGTRDFLPLEAKFINMAADTLLDEFSKWGYKRVATPSIDYLDVFLLSSKANELFKVADIGSGEMLSFRSDFTPQIGRLSSALRNSSMLPYKFSYFGPVLRNFDPILGKSREIWQAGAELIGPESPESDAELIIMGIESLKKLNVKDFSVDIGNVEFFRGIVSDIDEPARNKIEEFTMRKDSSGLNSFLEDLSLPEGKKDIIKELPFMFGEKAVIKRAWKMTDNERAINALETMERVISYIKSYKLEKYITIDLGEIRGLNYYTGTIFECFIPHVGYEIFGGGRYNNLIGMFGENCAGAGFAVNLDILSKYVDLPDFRSDDFLVFNKTDNKKLEVEIIMFLRKKGLKAESDFMDYDYSDALKYAEEQGIKHVVYIQNNEGKTQFGGAEPEEKYYILLKNIYNNSEKRFRTIAGFKKYLEL
ncbi:MAG: ATP phosphoribosyltransferase regulatory subunit [Deltaproteobacteria bacterium]|nr:ATP phosphoribosyltransferase regulatory subunit [Deltaproteobacteria bacterium]